MYLQGVPSLEMGINASEGRDMATATKEGQDEPRLGRPWSRPFRVPVVVLIVVFLAGTATGMLGLSVWVTPNVVMTGYNAGNVTVSSGCNGWWPQLSFSGYFHCAISLACPSTFGNMFVGPATVPHASNVVVSPSGTQIINCGTTVTLQVSGQLGYSGAVTVYVSS